MSTITAPYLIFLHGFK